jgi:hypothetical protein
VQSGFDPRPALRAKIESVGRAGRECAWPHRNVILLIDDSVFGVGELSAVSGAGSRSEAGRSGVGREVGGNIIDRSQPTPVAGDTEMTAM